MNNYKFSGHETFQCRHFWLKKGHDFLVEKNSFKANEAVVKLGVGKNMISSIQHWMKVFGLINNTAEIELTDFSYKIFSDEGYDPFLEDINSLYILHYKLLKNDSASLYGIVFNEFRIRRISRDFTSNQILDFLKRKLDKENIHFSENTLKNDIKVFLRMYQTSAKKGMKSIEDDFSSILLGLEMFEPVDDVFIEGEQVFRFKYDAKTALDSRTFLFAILDTFESTESISVEEIERLIGDKFLCSKEGVELKLQELQDKNFLVYKDDAGRREIQMKKRLDKWDILNKYYGRV